MTKLRFINSLITACQDMKVIKTKKYQPRTVNINWRSFKRYLFLITKCDVSDLVALSI